MKKSPFNADYVVVFFVSLVVIILELFLTSILNLKAWNHVVYTVIPFAILGYGIGANTYLIFKNKINQFSKKNVIGCNLVLIALFSMATYLGLAYLPLRIEYVVNIFTNVKAIQMLLLAYTIFMLPFISIGFLIVYLFAQDPKDSPKLYFYDLLGAGIGAALFFPFINHFAVMHSLIFFSLICFGLAISYIFPKQQLKVGVIIALLFVASLKFIPEIQNYTIDKAKGWEWIPGHFSSDKYKKVTSRWHSLGRTDIYRMTDKQ